ncbi:MAG: T9SS type A sorting domain-containing protein [Bacteroidota bacterium]
MRKFLLLPLIILFSIPAFAQQSFFGSLDPTDPTFNRPVPGTPPTTLATEYPNGNYDVISITIATPGLYTVTSSSNFDNFGILYGTAGFSAAAPLTNAITAVDDQSGTNFGFTYNFAAVGTYYLVITGFKNNVYGPYSITLTPVTTVPLKLLSFTAERTTAKGNLLKWTTAEELNIASFQVQHSTDGKNFRDLSGGNFAARNVRANSDYTFTDATPLPGLNFYRIKILETSGTFTQSIVAAVNNRRTSSAVIKLFPNPAVNFVYVEPKTGTIGKTQVSILGGGGETLLSKEFMVNSQQVLTLDVRKLSPGRYFVKTVNGSQQTITPFIKN